MNVMTLARKQVDEVEAIVKLSAVPLTSTQNCGGISGSDIPNPVYGYGRVDALDTVTGDADLPGVGLRRDIRLGRADTARDLLLPGASRERLRREPGSGLRPDPPHRRRLPPESLIFFQFRRLRCFQIVAAIGSRAGRCCRAGCLMRLHALTLELAENDGDRRKNSEDEGGRNIAGPFEFAGEQWLNARQSGRQEQQRRHPADPASQQGQYQEDDIVIRGGADPERQECHHQERHNPFGLPSDAA